MKRSTAVRHLTEMAEDCGGLVERLSVLDTPLRVASLWGFGRVLEPPEDWPSDLELVHAAVAVTLGEDEVPWFGRPPGTAWIESMMRWDKRPVHVMWRSADAPVWNHFIERPLLLWDEPGGLRHLAMEALGDGAGMEHHRESEPSAAELRHRLEGETRASLAAMSRTAADYDTNRWGRGKLRTYAEPLWEATAGYLDLQDALRSLSDGA